MKAKYIDITKELDSIRSEFLILKDCTYLISNSLGAVPRKAQEALGRYYKLWSEQGVGAWESEWWDLSRQVGDQVAAIIGAGMDEVTIMTSASQCHWVALSTKFSRQVEIRKKIVMSDHDFPSSIYAVSQIAEFMGWEVDMVRSDGQPGISLEEMLDRIDERTLFVATSHVYFKSAFVQDVAKISAKARQVGALTLIDGYHAPGCLPVDVKMLGVDFYVGGCLKWLCGGPGNAFLYVNPELSRSVKPSLTGWIAHKSPFSFSEKFEFTQGSYRFMAGTPPVPCLYTAQAGLDVIDAVGIAQIRTKSLGQTGKIIEQTLARGFRVFTPTEEDKRGGAVSIVVPHAFQVKQALGKRKIMLDFRKGSEYEPDVIRVGPHFYTTEEEINFFFKTLDDIYKTGKYKDYSEKIEHVT